MTEAKLNIYQRMNAIMAEVSYVQKEAKKSGLQYSFVSHDAVTGAVRGAMVKHGVVYHPQNINVIVSGNRVEMVMIVRFANIDEPEDYIDVPSYGHGIDQQDKAPGKAMSYCVKYALLKALGLETGDDVERDSIDYVPGAQEPIALQEPAKKVEFPPFAVQKKKPW